MKKFVASILIIVVVILTFSIYKLMNQKVEYEVVDVQDLPTEMRNDISSKTKKGFYLYNDDNYTYVYYRSSEEPSYITTDILVKKRFDKYIVTGVKYSAANDEYISFEKIIRFKKVSEKDMVLKEKDDT